MPDMARIRVILLLVLSLACLQCNGGGTNTNTTPTNTAEPAVVPKLGYEVVNSWPHDTNAVTQGLVFLDGKLIDSTGQQGMSSLQSVELQTGKVLKKVDVPEPNLAGGHAPRTNQICRLTQ